MTLFGKTIQTLQQSMDYATAKNKTISNNIANVDTPNYKAKNVVFKDVLRNEMSSSFQANRTRPQHFSFEASSHSQPFQVVTQTNTTYNHNGNNVDMDKEMTELAKNQIYYQAVVDRINGKFRSLESVIKGGR